MRPSYSNEYYLYYITVVLTDVQTWNSLNNCCYDFIIFMCVDRDLTV